MIFKIIAVLGFLLGCLNSVWQFCTFQKTHSERIKGKLSIIWGDIKLGKNVKAIQLEIWNDGYVPVYVKSVCLCWEGLNHVELNFESHLSIRGPLQPGNERTYFLPSIFPNLSEANNQPQDKVWISVKSAKNKELIRIQGDDLKTYLSEMVKSNFPQNNEKHKAD